MKKCNDCNIEMIEGELYGKPRWIDRDHDINNFFVHIKNGKNRNFYSENELNELNVRICPRCGKVESYINTDKLKQN